MDAARLSVPVAMLVFNRPDVTQRVFQAVRAARPRTLLVVADGPRPSRAGEAEQCRAVRDIFQRVDWECDLRTNFSEANLGCRDRVSSGIDWIFQQAQEAIILEDDCLPDPSFFPYCQELLARYRDEPAVMSISGDNFQAGRRRTGDSYYFSGYQHIWGWASWRRAWRCYDLTMRDWPEARDSGWLSGWLGDPAAVAYWTRNFQSVYDRSLDTWDYQWMYACWRRGGLCALPSMNLVSNIGFGTQATHTGAATPYANLPTTPMAFPLRHPEQVVRHARADTFTEHTLFTPGRLLRWRRRLWRIARSLWARG